MNDQIELSEKKEAKSFSFSKEVNGVRKTVRGEQVENGWVITVEKEWQADIPKSDGSGTYKDWKYETKKYISKDNPMNKKEDKKEKGETMDSFFSQIISATDSLMVD